MQIYTYITCAVRLVSGDGFRAPNRSVSADSGGSC